MWCHFQTVQKPQNNLTATLQSVATSAVVNRTVTFKHMTHAVYTFGFQIAYIFISSNTVNCCLLLLKLRQLSLEQTTLKSRRLVQVLVSKVALENR